MTDKHNKFRFCIHQ